MAVRVLCQRCHREAHFLASDLLAHGAPAGHDFEDIRFRCSACDSRKTRAHPVDLDATPAGFIIVQRLAKRS
ncbi:hypothetical protein [Aurantimonas sp. VKM B-3413]|uniref:hypothetical protein n=1 Tax=Aurantimonas sp. VKM B-3413 TaxID=2779401 RepID=UPI001E48E011|nr:hypothetical protein [Aurantimonas sp. VKM B-3413]MCB8840635.1 hypothetical protein [Aurantimonas sp. VKM B-3413]